VYSSHQDKELPDACHENSGFISEYSRKVEIIPASILSADPEKEGQPIHKPDASKNSTTSRTGPSRKPLERCPVESEQPERNHITSIDGHCSTRRTFFHVNFINDTQPGRWIDTEILLKLEPKHIRLDYIRGVYVHLHKSRRGLESLERLLPPDDVEMHIPSELSSLVICDGCNEWVHFACDEIVETREAIEIIEDYFCDACRGQGRVITFKQIRGQENQDPNVSDNNLENVTDDQQQCNETAESSKSSSDDQQRQLEEPMTVGEQEEISDCQQRESVAQKRRRAIPIEAQNPPQDGNNWHHRPPKKPSKWRTILQGHIEQQEI
jgi:hypothetical protein